MDSSKPVRRYTKKQIKKIIDGSCFFCHENNYCLLDAHRILPGEDGGKYTEFNTLTLCSNCHRRVHAGEIVIDRKYNSTGKALWTLHCWINGEEMWLPYSSFYTSPLQDKSSSFRAYH